MMPQAITSGNSFTLFEFYNYAMINQVFIFQLGCKLFYLQAWFYRFYGDLIM